MQLALAKRKIVLEIIFSFATNHALLKIVHAFNSIYCLKMRTLKTYIWSVLLYGCECWTISNNIEKKLDATEMWFLRRLMRISWTDRKTNEEVLQLAETKRSLMTTIRKRQLKFVGHINRKNGLEKTVLCGKIEGKRSRGRQRTTYIKSECLCN